MLSKNCLSPRYISLFRRLVHFICRIYGAGEEAAACCRGAGENEVLFASNQNKTVNNKNKRLVSITGNLLLQTLIGRLLTKIV